MPNYIVYACHYKKFSTIKEFVANDGNINCVDQDGNNILMLLINAIFKDPLYIHKDNVKYITDTIELILHHPLFNYRSKNDMNQDLINICGEYLKTNKKNKVGQSLLKAIMFYVKHSKVQPRIVVNNDYRAPSPEPHRQEICIIL